ncbi:gag/pol protein [Cucumis melo var. makuwa]|uniref:Gag/pol protein n=1 Tax=Cucumis melo var. makuwa TaxID=1194695 RepID=A0A5A7UAF5_CUCMM|nr:gag/pol protein [Cucumis melo var. makuwa]
MILVIADLRFVLMEECSPFPTQNASQSVRDAYDCWTKTNDKARVYILASMSDILSKKHEIMVTALHFNVVEMNETVFDEKSQVSFILKSLPKSFLQFHSNAEMNKVEYNMTTLLNELQTYQSLKGYVWAMSDDVWAFSLIFFIILL